MSKSINESAEFKRRFNEFTLTKGELEWRCAIGFYENALAVCAAGGGIQAHAPTLSLWLGADYSGNGPVSDLPPHVIERSIAYRNILDFHAYAVFGLLEVSDYIYGKDERLLDPDLAPVVACTIAEVSKDEQFNGIVEAAAARDSIDGDNEQPISVEGLAILANLKQKSIRNALTPLSGSGLELIRSGNDKGKITVVSARRWIKDQHGFRPTLNIIPRNVPDLSSSGVPDVIDPTRMVFVPATTDGEIFQPESRIGSDYIIGARGAESSFSEFTTALEALQTMPIPIWQCQSKPGINRYATGAHWVRILKPDLTTAKGE